MFISARLHGVVAAHLVMTARTYEATPLRQTGLNRHKSHIPDNGTKTPKSNMFLRNVEFWTPKPYFGEQ